MARPRLGQVDLNLLVSLEALLIDLSVTRAASRLGVTQSAMSHALNRLRTQFDDPLLVRRGTEMAKTALAELLGSELGSALENIERLVATRSTFDPARAARRFSVIAGDYAQIAVVSPLLSRLRRVAPGVDVIVRSANDPERALVDRQYALMIGPARMVPDALRRQALFTDRLVCVGRKKNPLMKRRIDLARYLKANHVLVSPRGLPGGIVDDALEQRGEKRRVLLEVPSFLTAALVVSDSDLLVTMPARLAGLLASRFGLAKVDLPFETPAIELVQLWHERHQSDPALAWLRA
ncbi:MAG: LysR family transcriptional regulator, partial [Polyangiaceae bacterium]